MRHYSDYDPFRDYTKHKAPNHRAGVAVLTVICAAAAILILATIR